MSIEHATSMSKLTTAQIRQIAHQLIQQSPGGVSFSSLRDQISRDNPQTPLNTIKASLVAFNAKLPSDVTKPSRGVFSPVDGTSAPTPPTPILKSKNVLEQDFYDPFTAYIRDELNEVVVAESLGGAGLGKKWGTPDVVGVYKPLASDRVRFQLEIVSGEIKIEPQESVTAFGQAIAYRLFSTKVYVVMPSTISKEDQNRLEALCMLFGVGLVLFDLNVTSPNFVTRIRAQRFTPDMFYVNVFADQLHKHNITLSQELF